MIGKLLGLAALIAVAGCGQEVQPPTRAVPTAAKATPSASASVPAEVAAHRPNVVRLTATTPSCAGDRRMGTGFAYSPDRVLTAAHVVAGAESPITVTDADGRRHRGDVVVFDPKRDVAVLRVAGLDADFLDFDSVDPGDRATFAAYSKDGKFTVRSGEAGPPRPALVNDLYNERAVSREVLVLTAAVDPGMSGGPLFGPHGDVVGMIFAANLDQPGSSYILTTREIARPAADGLRATAPVSTRECA
ncbi:trypsin-like peptidase domain-containing protein [Herbidospora galbida]|uniref:Trypsin-like peptidase domain-containing protein n=1 Tax=Herbidospora galbida TaxID=2575442 RepID=A0A4U3MCC6_9ACTN|nr:serine protease [Herbidospora galbida]TKK85367.1 trypsin-like peptidase domain-containing protein [Herbidospora galbida]